MLYPHEKKRKLDMLKRVCEVHRRINFGGYSSKRLRVIISTPHPKFIVGNLKVLITYPKINLNKSWSTN